MAVVTLIFVSLLLLASCSSRERNPHSANGDILAAAAPEGVDKELWDQLTRELARVVAERDREAAAAGKSVSLAAQGRGSEVRDFILYPVGGGATAVWTYRNQGDYDLNGEVNISDLTPVGAHFGKRSSDPNWQVVQFADGDGNGEVNISDVTPLGNNFGARVAGYVVQERGNNVGAEYETVDFEPYPGGEPSSGEYPQAEFVLANPQPLHRYRVVPSATAAAPYELGVPSNSIAWSGALAQQPWSQAGANYYRNCLSKLNGPNSIGSSWEFDFDGSVYIFAAPVADRQGVVYCTTFTTSGESPPTLEGSTGSVWAIDRGGTLRWHYQTDAAILTQPVLHPDGTVFVETYKHEVIALYPDGKLKWKQQLTTNSEAFLWGLTIDEDGALFAMDSTPALRKLGPGGSISWTQPIDPPFSLAMPVAAGDWIIVPRNSDAIDAFQRSSGAPDGSLNLSSAFAQGMLIKPATGVLWAGMSGPEDLLGIPLDIGAEAGYISPYNFFTPPALNADGEIVFGEQIPAAMPGEPDTGRVVGIDDNAVQAWERPLAVSPLGRLTCDAAGRVYLPTFGSDADSGIYCINAAHDIEWFLPLEAICFGTCIGGEGYLAALVAVEGDLLGRAKLIGIEGP